ncbi:kynurenine 3-monooxygenase [Euwallacea similis]|uniref:kynurenine 3-monooxygenase n=1 Tax=Euwallacea similis TaxID=1736056 RepID=UPI00345035DE
MKTVNQDSSAKRTAIVIGGGLVGSLCTCLLAERGYKVTLYEKRPDIRKLTIAKGRSINLALSHRGRKGLKLVGVEEQVLKNAIPMIGRFLHRKDGFTVSVPYDPVSSQCIYSVGRNLLNQILLDVAERSKSVSLCFEHKLVNVDFNTDIITIQKNGWEDLIKTTADFIVGADGAFSSLRAFMQKTPLFNFSQNFVDHGYLELSIPPEKSDNMINNHLHIWPRGDFMMIALPNRDKSWTVTLFMPFKNFDAITNAEELLSFFKTTFPDAIPLMGEDTLKDFYFKTPPQSLVSIKCSQYHLGKKFMIIGDAAHAIVPFYGQGMNAGFEDCTVLNEILNETDDDIQKSIVLFTERRRGDAFAISDLALYNYKEMRDLVTKPSYQARKVIDTYLAKIWPKFWVPLYNSVSFSHMGYRQCVENRKWQNKMLIVGLSLAIAIAILMSLVLRILANK